MAKKKKITPYLIYAALLFLIIAAGRASMAVYNNLSVDIAYDPRFSNLFQHCSDILNGVKLALGFGGIAYCTHHVSKKAGNITLLVYLAGLFLENAARFLLDWLSSGVAYYGIPLTLTVLAGRFLLEGVFALAAWLISRIFLRQSESGDNAPNKKKTHRLFSAGGSGVVSVLFCMTVPIINEIRYLLDHFTLYGELTSEELAVCIGSFLNILVMYGGIPLLCLELVFLLMKKLFTTNNR